MKKAWISLLISLLALTIQAQSIEETLFQAGFENVQVKKEKDTIKIFFEHREFRNPFHSMQYANLLLPQVDSVGKTLIYIPLYHNNPIGSYTPREFNFKALDVEDRAFFRAKNKPFKNYRFHLRVKPDIAARFGYYDHPFETKINLVIDSRIYLAPGLSLQTGILIPIENSLDNQDKSLRLAPSMIHYFTQPFPGHFLGVSAGSFYSDRYGLDFQYRYAPLASPWSFGLESGLTGYHWQNGGIFYTRELKDIYAVADVEYRLPFENLSIKLSGGQFLFEDKGIRTDLIKQYGAVDFGLFVSASEIGSTVGFQFAFSLFPGKIYRGKNLELRTTEEFRWEYSYNNEDPVARKYRLGMPRLSDMLRQYNSGFGKNLN